MIKAEEIVKELKKFSSPVKAQILANFFKTGLGDYGAGDKFLGVVVPLIRKTGKRFWRQISKKELSKLISSPWHEIRLAGLLMVVDKFEHEKDRLLRKRWVDFYLANKKFVNNWDLVDLTAPKVLGAYLLEAEKKEQKILETLSASDDLWQKRIAILATLPFIKEGRFAPTLSLVDYLREDKEDLIHKALGWMLREIGKKDESVLENFLQKNASLLPRTTLRYAIERLSPAQREFFLKVKKKN